MLKGLHYLIKYCEKEVNCFDLKLPQTRLAMKIYHFAVENLVENEKLIGLMVLFAAIDSVGKVN